jgi:predicted transcriptional regulator
MINIESHKVQNIPAAISGIESVKPDDTLIKVITLMKLRDYSQVAVMTTKHNIKGVITWKLIANSKTLDFNNTLAKEIMSKKINYSYLDDNIINVLETLKLSDEDYVFVKDKKEVWSGIITSHDIIIKYSDQISPLISLEKIEKKLRNIILDFFNNNISELNNTYGLSLENINDIVFSDYIKIFSHNSFFAKAMPTVDKKTFIKSLTEVNLTRNKFMHFRVDGLDVDEIRLLNKFAEFIES